MWRGMKLSNSLLARSLSESSSSTFLWFSQSDSMSHTTTRICKIRLSALFAEARTRRLSSHVYTMAWLGGLISSMLFIYSRRSVVGLMDYILHPDFCMHLRAKVWMQYIIH